MQSRKSIRKRKKAKNENKTLKKTTFGLSLMRGTKVVFDCHYKLSRLVVVNLNGPLFPVTGPDQSHNAFHNVNPNDGANLAFIDGEIGEASLQVSCPFSLKLRIIAIFDSDAKWLVLGSNLGG